MLFKEGDFSAPMFTHGEVPSGVPAMTQLKGDITYTFEKSERGGRVRIATANPEAVKAIHEFLRYQIKDHQTGDSLQMDKQASNANAHSCSGMTGTCLFAASTHATEK
jgi:hypothetical protein